MSGFFDIINKKYNKKQGLLLYEKYYNSHKEKEKNKLEDIF